MRPPSSALFLLLLCALAGATRGAFPLIGGARASGFELAMAERFAESGCLLANQSKNVSLFKDAWLFFISISVCQHIATHGGKRATRVLAAASLSLSRQECAFAPQAPWLALVFANETRRRYPTQIKEMMSHTNSTTPYASIRPLPCAHLAPCAHAAFPFVGVSS